jgi:hypothetical protein
VLLIDAATLQQPPTLKHKCTGSRSPSLCGDLQLITCNHSMAERILTKFLRSLFFVAPCLLSFFTASVYLKGRIDLSRAQEGELLNEDNRFPVQTEHGCGAQRHPEQQDVQRAV